MYSSRKCIVICGVVDFYYGLVHIVTYVTMNRYNNPFPPTMPQCAPPNTHISTMFWTRIMPNHRRDRPVLSSERTHWKQNDVIGCGASHMSNNRQMSVAMQRIVDFIFMVTNSTLLRNSTVTLLLAGFSVGRSIRNSPLLCNGWRNYEVTRVVFSGSVRNL
jgi:hypothetical protein